MEEQKSISFREYYQILRNQIIIAADGAKELALKNFDDIAKKLDEQLTINEQNKKQGEKNVAANPTDKKE